MRIPTAWWLNFLSDFLVTEVFINRNQVVLDHMIPNAVVNQMGPTFSSMPPQNLVVMA